MPLEINNDCSPEYSIIKSKSNNALNNNIVYVSEEKRPLSPPASAPHDRPESPTLTLSSHIGDIPVRDPPPDGGWGWVIVFASFMISLISDGISLSSGTIFVELSDYFDESKSKTSWVLSIILSMPLLAGPIASYLTDRYGCRTMCIIGSILAAVGFIISFLANSLELLYFTFTISGFGLALCLVTSVVIIPYYFEKKRGLATGLSVCGTGIGTFLFPPLVSYLLDNYGWRGTFLILAGFFLNIAVFGCLMRDFETDPSKRSESSSEDGTSRDLELCVDNEFSGLEGMNPRLCNSLLQLPTYLQKEYMANMTYEAHAHNNHDPATSPQMSSSINGKSQLLDGIISPNSKSPKPTSPVNTFVQIASPDSNGPVVSLHEIKTKRKTSQRLATRQPGSGWLSKGLTHNSEYLKKLRLQRGSLTYRGAMLNIPRYKLRTSSCPDIYRNSIMTISESTKKYQFIHDLKEVLLDMVDFKIFSNVRFSFFCISNFILYACVDIPYVYLQDYAITLGFDKEPASFLISILGILNTLGMVIVGYFGDKAYVDSALLYMGFVIVCGFSMAVIPWLTHYAVIACMAALYGFTISANYTLMSVIVVNLISLDNFTSAYGMLLLIQGIASLVGPPIAGVLYDLYGTYNLTFLSTGLSIILSGFLVLPVIRSYPFKICIRRPATKQEEEVEQNETHHGERVRFQKSPKIIPTSI